MMMSIPIRFVECRVCLVEPKFLAFQSFSVVFGILKLPVCTNEVQGRPQALACVANHTYVVQILR